MSQKFQPDSNEAPETLLRGWAKAYRDTPEHRFPSDPHAEFFPVDMEFAADEIAALKSQVEEQDRLLAEAADFLNRASRMDAMDLGAKITAYRLAQQKSVAPSLEGRGGAA